MKYFTLSMLLLIASMTNCLAVNYSSLGDNDYDTICRDLDTDHNTSMYIDYKWKEYTGQTVQWTGKVIDVKGGRGKALIYIEKSNSGKTYKDYNIVLYTTDMDSAAALKKNENITFEGTLYRYKPIRNGGTIFYLKNGTVSKTTE